MSDLMGLVEILEPDGLCHYTMNCEHGQTECLFPVDHPGDHKNPHRTTEDEA